MYDEPTPEQLAAMRALLTQSETGRRMAEISAEINALPTTPVPFVPKRPRAKTVPGVSTARTARRAAAQPPVEPPAEAATADLDPRARDGVGRPARQALARALRAVKINPAGPAWVFAKAQLRETGSIEVAVARTVENFGQ
jgi:hypothetical protein